MLSAVDILSFEFHDVDDLNHRFFTLYYHVTITKKLYSMFNALRMEGEGTPN